MKENEIQKAPLTELLLIVDDWEALEVYENRLSPHFHLRSASFGSDGVRMALEFQPDRIFLDLTFEDMSTSEACLALRASSATRSIPITLVLSRDEKTLDLAGVFPLPGDRSVQRPYPFSELLEKLKN